jgi:ketosteroid isomerase-like protein
VSQENVEIVRRSIDAFGRGDLEGVLETLAPGFEFEPSGRFMDRQTTYRGRRASSSSGTTSVLPGRRRDSERMDDLGGQVLTRGKLAGRGGESGIDVDAEQAWLHTVRDGEIVRLRSFMTWAEAREVAGVLD